MQAQSIFRASQALSEAKGSNYQLSHFDFPRFFGKKAAERAADELRTQAVAAGERAAVLFDQAGLDPQAVIDVRRAVAYLRNADMNSDSLQRAHHSAEHLFNIVQLRNSDALEKAIDVHTRALLAASEALNGTSAEERLAQAAELFARDPASLDGQEWLRLAALLEYNPSGRLLAGPHKLDGLRPLAQIAREIGAEMSEPGAKMERRFSSDTLPNYFASWRNAMTAPESALVGIRSTSRSQMEAELEGYLAGFQQGNGAGADNPIVDRLIEQTRDMIELNLARMAGRPTPGAVRGYSTHPDYAEIGRIRANTVVIDELTRPPEAVSRLQPPHALGEESLTW